MKRQRAGAARILRRQRWRRPQNRPRRDSWALPRSCCRPALRTHAEMEVRRAALASRSAAERAAVAAIGQVRRDRLALLEMEALPLLRGIAQGALGPSDGAGPRRGP